MRYNKIIVEVKYNSIYKCSHCSVEVVGDTVKFNVICENTQELKCFMDKQRQVSYYMPIGWSYNGEYSCGCRKKSIDKLINN